MQSDLANLQKKKEEEKVGSSYHKPVPLSSVLMNYLLNYHACDKQALKELRAKAQQKGSFGGSGLKKSGKK